MKNRIRKRNNLLIRRAILFFTLICLSLTYFVNDFKTDIFPWNIQQNATMLVDYSEKTMNRFELLNIATEFIKKRTYNDTSWSELKQNGSGNTLTCRNVTFARRLPSAIIIGVKKCGTRALLEYLRLHPGIKATGPEPHFFDRYYHMGLEWYRQKMPKSNKGQMTIEKTPRYFVTEEAPERIYNMSRNIKLILVVRNPVTRAISDFTQAVSKGEYNETVTFRSRAIRRDGTVNKKWSAVNIGLYAHHLKQWLDFFPMKNIHVVDGENLIRNPIHELNCVQDFLSLGKMIQREVIYMNATKGFPCIRKGHTSPPFKCFRSSKGRQHSYADKKTIALLHEFYKPYNKDFYKITKRHFNW